MRIVFLTNNFEVVKPLYDFLKRRNEVILVQNRPSLDSFKRFNPSLFISYNYHYIIPKQIFDEFKNKFINLHISYLPYNRGAYPNVWGFIDNTPKGVSIHLIDEGIDT